jgi:hypothetical protein
MEETKLEKLARLSGKVVRDKQDENSPAIRMRKCRRMRDERRA